MTHGEQELAVDEPAWARRKPTHAGVYGVRGFELRVAPEDQFEAVVAVRIHEGELVCNLHVSTSNDDFYDWAPLSELSDKFEWCKFTFARGGRRHD